MQKKYILTIVVIFLSMFVIVAMAISGNGWLIHYKPSFKGKVIDAETKGPIEGAVVAAIYEVSTWGIFHSGSAYADVQETITDSNGEFHISSNFFLHWPFDLGLPTKFIIFKPGYWPYPFYDFLIYPVNETFKFTDEHIEGIVLEKRIKDNGMRKLYKEKFNVKSPFIPLKNPLEKVRNLDLPFDADVMESEEIMNSRYFVGKYSSTGPFKSYTLIGLPKAKTMEERKESHSYANKIPPGFKKKAPIWKKMLRDEYNFIFKGVR